MLKINILWVFILKIYTKFMSQNMYIHYSNT